MKRNESIIQKDMSRCWVCGSKGNLHIHEIYFGNANRKKSIQYGCYVALCGKHHNLSSNGVHYNKELDTSLKKLTQAQFELSHTRDEFIKIFGKSYL